jgi:hypothetical protein
MVHYYKGIWMNSRNADREEHEHQAKLLALREAIEEGDASGVADDNVFTRVREKLNLPPATSDQQQATSRK